MNDGLVFTFRVCDRDFHERIMKKYTEPLEDKVWYGKFGIRQVGVWWRLLEKGRDG